MWRSDNRYYGGGRGGFTSRGGGHTGADGRGDRYHGGGRGGYTTGERNEERTTRNTERDERDEPGNSERS